jgi:fibronectin type 3 domain-containing protein
MKLFALLLFASAALAQCPPPTPGSPHVCLTWVASTTPSVTYNVYRATVSKGENYSAPLNSSPIGTLSFYDTTVALGTNYFYTVAAVGSGGALSTPSQEVSALIPVPPNPPNTPAVTID